MASKARIYKPCDDKIECRFCMKFYCHAYLRSIVCGAHNVNIRHTVELFKCHIRVPSSKKPYDGFIVAGRSENDCRCCIQHIENYLSEFCIHWRLMT